ncbi:cupin domain-containing protein [Patescibacteria group bacterium]|nr:cupin domain-containing protein [Patescibacteria group bacterium]
MKRGFIANIEEKTLANDNFRQVLYTGEHLQLVVMNLAPGEDIGKEVHENNDQFIRIESGTGVAYIDGVETPVADDFAIVIPASAEHNVTNTGDIPMKLYTVYGPAEHRNGVIHMTKADAEANHDADHFDGVTSE